MNHDEGQKNADKIQSILSDNLFPAVNHISDVKQVLEYMERVAQAVSEEQLRAAILLEMIGQNERLHGKDNPYKWLVTNLIGTVKETGIWKKAVAPTSVFLDTMQELIPKPPRPIVVTGNGGKEK